MTDTGRSPGGRPGWYPDPWQQGGWRYHDGTEWTSWTGPPPGPPPIGFRPAPGVGGWAAGPVRPAPEVELASEDRVRAMGTIAAAAVPLVQGLVAIFGAIAFRRVFRDLFDVAFDVGSTEADIERAADAATERAGELWWLNIVGWIPLAGYVLLAVWTNRVAGVAARLGYPARLSTTWAAAGWFVPVVNLWFPYQAVADSLSPDSPHRGQVLTWWLLWLASGAATAVGVVVAVASDDDATATAVSALALAVGVAAAVLGARVVALVHDDHAAALGRP